MSRAAYWTRTSLTSRKALERGAAEIQRLSAEFRAKDAIRNPFVPAAAYKNSGIGVEFGEEGLREFCHIQVIGSQKW